MKTNTMPRICLPLELLLRKLTTCFKSPFPQPCLVSPIIVCPEHVNESSPLFHIAFTSWRQVTFSSLFNSTLLHTSLPSVINKDSKHLISLTSRLNRFSMPVNSSRHPQRLSVSGTGGSSFGLANTTSFLFDEDDDKLNPLDLTSPIAKAFAQLEGDDTFPTLTSDGLKVCLFTLLSLKPRLTLY